MFRRAARHEAAGAVTVGAPDPRWSAARPWLFALFLILFTGCYFYFARHLINHTNGDRNRSDQQNNINLALEAKADVELDFAGRGTGALWDWFPRRTDGVVNPLWPWLAARAHRDGMTEEEFFVRGKWVNVGITAGLLLLGGAFAAARFSLPAAINLVLVGGFAAFLPHAVWFQPEPLFFTLFLLAWLAALGALLDNSLLRYALFGGACGLAYLAKASALPLLAAFLGVATLRCLWCGVRAWVGRRKGGQSDARWCPQAHLIGSVLCVLAFLTVAGPRLNYAAAEYGSPFHSYPSYWMWFDRFEPDCIDFMVEHRDAEQLAAIPDAERPSLRRFLDERGAGAFVERTLDGARATASDLFHPKRAKGAKDGAPKPWRALLPDRGIYLYGLSAALVGLWLWSLFAKPKPEGLPQRAHCGSAWAALFVVGTVLLFLCLYGFYRPIGKGDRFNLSLYAPVLVSLIWAAEAVRERLVLRGTSPWAPRVYYAFHLLLTAAVVARVVEVARHPVFWTK